MEKNKNSYSTYYYKRKSQKNKAYLRSTAFFLLFIAIILSLLFLIIDSCFVKKQKNNYFFECYLLCNKQCDDLETAEQFAKSSNNRGGAGYIYKNELKYNVVLSVYFDINEANLVVDKLKKFNENPYIITISKQIFKTKKLNNSETKQLNKNFEVFYSVFKDIYKNSNLLESGIKSEWDVKVSIKESASILDSLFQENFTFSKFKRGELSNINKYITDISHKINLIYLQNKISSKNLRYLNIQIIVSLVELWNNYD